jgi:hypothetical protein
MSQMQPMQPHIPQQQMPMSQQQQMPMSQVSQSYAQPYDQPPPQQGISTRTLLWITVILLVVAITGAAGIAYVLFRARG